MQRSWDIGTKVWFIPSNLICCGTVATQLPNWALCASWSADTIAPPTSTGKSKCDSWSVHTFLWI